MKPEAVSTPAFSTRAFCAALNPRRSRALSVSHRITPPIKMAKVVSSGKYMPTAKSMTLFTSSMIMANPIRIPAPTSGQGILPPTMPCASEAMRPACGAESWGSPKPIPPRLMLPPKSITMMNGLAFPSASRLSMIRLACPWLPQPNSFSPAPCWR